MEYGCHYRNNRWHFPLGSDVKVSIEWSYPSDPSVTLDEVFAASVEVKLNGKTKLTIGKEHFIRKESVVEGQTVVNWYIPIESSLTGPGDVTLRMTVKIIDNDMPSGYMTCVNDADPMVTIYV